MSSDQVRLINLPKILDDRGNLSFFQNDAQIPFGIRRVYWVYDVPAGIQRGGHAYHELREVIVALSGSFDIVVNDGRSEKRFSMNRSNYGLYVPSKIWRHLENFSTNALALVAADLAYDPADYMRDFDVYKDGVNK
jgi:dTDP-4-dehydrorhamnose 3,5-epimerase-like enzyme